MWGASLGLAHHATTGLEPALYLIDRQGRIAAVNPSPGELEAAVAKATARE